MKYQIPEDLKPIAPFWTSFPLEERIRTAKNIRGYPDEIKKMAVAMTLNEQPDKIPVNNVAGIMCWGKKEPWGWRVLLEVNPPISVVGYSLIKEGMTGVKAPFLVFASIEDSLRFVMEVCKKRRIKTPEDYAVFWAGLTIGSNVWKDAVAGCRAQLERVNKVWLDVQDDDCGGGALLWTIVVLTAAFVSTIVSTIISLVVK